MMVDLKICENENCWHIMGWFPRTECQFCGSKEFSTHKVYFWLVLWWSTQYHHDDRRMGVLMNYKGCDHVFVRSELWECWSNNCDKNWGYVHYMCVEDAPDVDAFARARKSREGFYIGLE